MSNNNRRHISHLHTHYEIVYSQQIRRYSVKNFVTMRIKARWWGEAIRERSIRLNTLPQWLLDGVREIKKDTKNNTKYKWRTKSYILLGQIMSEQSTEADSNEGNWTTKVCYRGMIKSAKNWETGNKIHSSSWVNGISEMTVKPPHIATISWYYSSESVNDIQSSHGYCINREHYRPYKYCAFMRKNCSIEKSIVCLYGKQELLRWITKKTQR